jgi:endonuclease/exonuclease/phosphatase family metal-dependent hydrolase
VRPRQRWSGIVVGVLLLVLVFPVAGICGAESPSPRLSAARIQASSAERLPESSLRFVSLNVAHGRKDGLNQLLQRSSRIRGNLRQVSDLLRRVDADVVALQEADGPSRWSGSFDHVAWLSGQAGYAWQASSAQAQSWMYSYGTAILSRWPLSDSYAHTFRPSPPTPDKGFQMVRLDWPPGGATGKATGIDVVSVHLDFSRARVRQRQIAELIEVLGRRSAPVVVLGDFNSEWKSKDEVVRKLAERLGLLAYQPESDDLVTYPSAARRLDWILISRELEFRAYGVLPDIVSDHLAVVAEVGVATNQRRVAAGDEH